MQGGVSRGHIQETCEREEQVPKRVVLSDKIGKPVSYRWAVAKKLRSTRFDRNANNKAVRQKRSLPGDRLGSQHFGKGLLGLREIPGHIGSKRMELTEDRLRLLALPDSLDTQRIEDRYGSQFHPLLHALSRNQSLSVFGLYYGQQSFQNDIRLRRFEIHFLKCHHFWPTRRQ